MDYRTGFAGWDLRSGDAAFFRLAGAVSAREGIALDRASAARGSDPFPPGSYEGGNFYNGASYLVGEALGPEFPAAFPFVEAIPSWTAATPDGTWIEVLLRAADGGDWTGWYNLGVWSSGSATVRRHSVSGQDDGAAEVRTDTLRLRSPGTAVQMRFRLFSAAAGAVPVLRAAAVAYSTTKPTDPPHPPGRPALWGRVLEGVPQRSQMVYPDGGKVWCSPTSVSMVIGYWNGDRGPAEPGVRAAVDGVFDRVFRGYGNWSFNAAYAGSLGFSARVARLDGLARLEPWIAAGVPVVMSVSWNREKGRSLAGAPMEKSNGHLTTLVGFDAQGDPVMNEPASPTEEGVRRTYPRGDLESRWLEASGGAVYMIHPHGRKVPALGRGGAGTGDKA